MLANPYDIEQMAEASRSVTEMEVEERKTAMQRRRREVREYNIFRRASTLIAELCEVWLDEPQTGRSCSRGVRWVGNQETLTPCPSVTATELIARRAQPFGGMSCQSIRMSLGTNTRSSIRCTFVLSTTVMEMGLGTSEVWMKNWTTYRI